MVSITHLPWIQRHLYVGNTLLFTPFPMMLFSCHYSRIDFWLLLSDAVTGSRLTNWVHGPSNRNSTLFNSLIFFFFTHFNHTAFRCFPGYKRVAVSHTASLFRFFLHSPLCSGHFPLFVCTLCTVGPVLLHCLQSPLHCILQHYCCVYLALWVSADCGPCALLGGEEYCAVTALLTTLALVTGRAVLLFRLTQSVVSAAAVVWSALCCSPGCLPWLSVYYGCLRQCDGLSVKCDWLTSCHRWVCWVDPVLLPCHGVHRTMLFTLRQPACLYHCLPTMPRDTCHDSVTTFEIHWDHHSSASPILAAL